MNIQNTRSVENHKLKILLTGPSGSGKTTSVVSLQSAGFKPLVFSFEGGLLSVAGRDVSFIDGTKDDAGKLIPKEKRGDRLRQIYPYVFTDECRQRFDTIFLDSLTEISQCLYDELKVQFPERKDSLVLFGELGQRSRDVIKSFRDLDYHVVCTCLTKISKDETGKRFVDLDLIGGISDKANQFFDTVTYIRVMPDGERHYICQPTDAIPAKDRSGKLLPSEKSLGDIFMKSLTSEENNAQPRPI